MLSHLKILDFSTLLPGPYATMILADMGAQVLRVESVNHTDFLRNTAPFDDGIGTQFMHLNRSKKLIALDLKKAAALQVAKELINAGGYDIIIEQFRPGVMKRLGLDYQTLQASNPSIIYCSITGYGQTGPYKDRAGHDNNYLALSGVADYSRRKNDRPVPQGIQIADIAGGSMHAVAGILASVSHREQTGQGQFIDVSMTDTAFALNALTAPGLLVAGEAPEAEAMMLNGGTFYDYYETLDGRFFSVGSLEPPFFKALCEAIERPDLIPLGKTAFDPANDEKTRTQQMIKSVLKDSFASKSFSDWMDIFSVIDACVEPVLSLAEAAEHPQIVTRKMIVDIEKPNGHQRQVAHPIHYGNYTPKYQLAGGKSGRDTDKVLSDLGYSPDSIYAMRQSNAIK